MIITFPINNSLLTHFTEDELRTAITDNQLTISFFVKDGWDFFNVLDIEFTADYINITTNTLNNKNFKMPMILYDSIHSINRCSLFSRGVVDNNTGTTDINIFIATDIWNAE